MTSDEQKENRRYPKVKMKRWLRNRCCICGRMFRTLNPKKATCSKECARLKCRKTNPPIGDDLERRIEHNRIINSRIFRMRPTPYLERKLRYCIDNAIELS